ncbi:hypothetical protein LIER_23943 [Lithospermum erythrorhizon]|uniref:Uncharacterized protein n=1 Tax=Lithospermum erythrorhizon TaxID=34254 RepID=A0AAV3R2B8_LITER
MTPLSIKSNLNYKLAFFGSSTLLQIGVRPSMLKIPRIQVHLKRTDHLRLTILDTIKTLSSTQTVEKDHVSVEMVEFALAFQTIHLHPGFQL